MRVIVRVGTCTSTITGGLPYDQAHSLGAEWSDLVVTGG